MIRTLTGHLTATNKRHIEQMIDGGLFAARSPRIEYYLHHTGPVWRVECRTREDNGYGTLVTRRHMATFEHEGGA